VRGGAGARSGVGFPVPVPVQSGAGESMAGGAIKAGGGGEKAVRPEDAVHEAEFATGCGKNAAGAVFGDEKEAQAYQEGAQERL